MRTEVYFKNEKGQIQETTLKDLLQYHLNKSGFKMDIGRFEGEDCSWIDIVQESKKPSEVVTNIMFTDNGNVITDVNVYESPIRRIVDEDDGKQII